MAINGVVESVTRNLDGTATIILRGPNGNSVGQPRLIIDDPPVNFEAIIGTHIRSDAKWVYVGKIRLLERLGGWRVRLVSRSSGIHRVD